MDISQDVESRKSKKKKVDPSFKSKRYRDKLRAEVKALENLIPVDRPTLNKKLDSQTIYRLAIAFLRVKTYLKARNLSPVQTGQRTRKNFHANHNSETSIQGQNYDRKHGTQNEQNMASDNPQERSRETMPMESHSGFGNEVESLLDPLTLYNIIEGFVVLASADGTIMFVTENVSKYTGFSQVDLIHRCLYSIVHPDDFQDVTDALEIHDSRHQNKGLLQQDTDGHSSDNIENLFCRIRCYHGNTPGYIKLHCSGKMHHLPDMPKTTQTSKSVVVIYCQPFLKTGNDVMDDEKKDVFWSKHDLDLRFKEIEETSIHGYSSSDVCGKSLYQYVHPEDLSILDNVHRAITKVTEVQTSFFRLQMKQGDWLWVYCKGKVICKNSKKFSIVFSHCPVRDDDNVFIKQEALLRRHRLASFLQSSDVSVNKTYPQHQHSGHLAETLHLPNQQRHNHHQYHNHQAFDSVLQHRDNTHTNGYKVDRNDLSSSFDIHSMSCPSSWHVNSDRHSPVLPNNHAVQKTLQRERQMYIAEYRRKQYFEQKRTLMTSVQPRNTFSTCSGQFHSVHSTSVESNSYTHRDNFNSHADYLCGSNIPYNGCMGDYGYMFPPVQEVNYSCNQDFNPENDYFMPHNPSHNQYWLPRHQKQGQFDHLSRVAQRSKYATDICGFDFGKHDVHRDKQYLVSPVSPNVPNFYSSANVRFSMLCNPDANLCNPVPQDNVHCSTEMHRTFKGNKGASNHLIKSESGSENCCAMSERKEPTVKQSVKYDIEASVYMRIVEAQNTGTSHTTKDFPAYSSLVSL